MPSYICVTCCAEFPPADRPPETCPICADPRQYIGLDGQQWTTGAGLVAAGHATDIREEEPGLLGIGVAPRVGIGQRALLVTHSEGGVMFDGVPLLDDPAIERIERHGGVRAMVMSHPHLYGAMVTNSVKLGNVPVYIPEVDRDWVMYPHENVEFFSGETLDLGDGLTLYVTGGHFDGSAFLHWPGGADGKGALITGDTILVGADPDWVSFLWSTPNHVQLGPRARRRIVEIAEKLEFDRLYSGWWPAVIRQNARARVRASLDRIERIQAEG